MFFKTRRFSFLRDGTRGKLRQAMEEHAAAARRPFDDMGFAHEDDSQCSWALAQGGGAKAGGKCDKGPPSDLAAMRSQSVLENVCCPAVQRSSLQCGSARSTYMIDSEREDSMPTSGSFRRVSSSPRCSASLQGNTGPGGSIIALLILAILAPSGHAVSAIMRLPPILSASSSCLSSLTCAAVASVDPLMTSSAFVDPAFLPRLLPSQPQSHYDSSLLRACTWRCRQSAAVRSEQDKGDKLTLMIDLDKTALFGNDGNDLGIALQWMHKDFSKVQELYKLLINPSLRKVYDFYVKQGKQVEVVIYTRRPQIVYYKSCVGHRTLPVRYAEGWHDDQGQIYFPPHVQTSEDIFATWAGPELEEDEVHDVMMSLDRLLAARNAVAHELGLSTLPSIVVTAEAKKTDATAQHLNVPVESCLLFDDNVELRDDPHVVLVEPLVSLPSARRKQVLEFMQRELPAESLEEDLIEYLEEANPSELSIRRDVNNTPTWWVAETVGKVPGWRTPEISPSRGAPLRQPLPLKPGADSLHSVLSRFAHRGKSFVC